MNLARKKCTTIFKENCKKYQFEELNFINKGL